jgi:parallel beta-helix repeat protein
MKTESMKAIVGTFLILSLLLIVGCSKSTQDPVVKGGDSPLVSEPSDDSSAGSSTNDSMNIYIEPGPDAMTKAQEALILAEPGDVIEFGEGIFEFDGTLSVDGIQEVTVRGQGMEKTVLNFSRVQAGKGGEGMKVKADNFTIEDLTIEDTPGDAIKLQDCNGLTMRRIRTWWTRGPATENGAYGLYPVLCNNVLIEDCVAECASDAGIYVGQSKQVIVRRCRAERNVAGIEIENCTGVDVYENIARNNTGGILVFSLPGLTLKNGSDCRVFDNEMVNNNHENFAKSGAIVSTVPPGTGLMIMANDRVEAFGNQFDGNISANCLIVSFLVAQRKFEDAEYDPYPEAIHIHDNSFSNGGTDPQGEFLPTYKAATGQPLPDIVFDGILDAAKLTDDSLPEKLNFSIHDNGNATFVNLDLGNVLSGKEPRLSTDLSPFSGSLPPIKPVMIPGVE